MYVCVSLYTCTKIEYMNTYKQHTHTHTYTHTHVQASDVEISCEKWLDSPLFARGVSMDSSSHDDLTTAEGSAEARVLDVLIQPLLGVRLSPHLDVMERAVIGTILHHSGALARVLTTASNARTPRLEAMCQNVSLAARGVRRHVMEVRDIANLSLKEGEEPHPWSTYTEPVLARCKLLLATAALCKREEWEREEDSESGESGDVYRCMWSLAHGNSFVKRAVTLVCVYVCMCD
jgi:hypothetical protein